MLRRYVLRATSHASRILPNARAAAKSPSEAKQRRSLITGVEFLGKAVPIVVAKVVDQLMATSASVDLTKLLKRAFAALLNPLDLGPQHESLSGVGLLPRKGVFEVSDLLKNPGRRLYQIVGPSNSGKTFAVKTLVVRACLCCCNLNMWHMRVCAAPAAVERRPGTQRAGRRILFFLRFLCRVVAVFVVLGRRAASELDRGALRAAAHQDRADHARAAVPQHPARNDQ